MLHSADLPVWLTVISWISLALGVASTIFIAIDVSKRPQPMRVMDFVWSIDGLWGSVAWVGAYLWWGRAKPKGASNMKMGSMKMDMPGMKMGDMKMSPALGKSGKPHSMPVSVFVGTSHCGAGCSLADLLVEWLLFAFPAVAVVGGWHWLFTDHLFAGWVVSYVVALMIGIGFQYAAIAPMNPQRSVGRNIWMAAKADVLSLSAWQIGMYGGMAIGQLWLFPTLWGGTVATDTPVFWLMMQIAMLFGFCTAYPVNWLLIKTGVKERM